MISSIKQGSFITSPGPGVGVHGSLYYTRSTGIEMFCDYGTESRSDLCDGSYTMLSRDNGRTWSEPEFHEAEVRRPDGILRRSAAVALADPFRNRFIRFFTEGLFDGDDPLQGMTRYQIRYRVSANGARSWITDELMVQDGDEFDENHPFPGLTVGKNSIMFGDRTCVPIVIPDGTILVPVQMCPTGPDGFYHNPGGGLTYHDTAIIAGRWRSETKISWKLSAVLKGDPERTTRGVIEPTIAELDDGRILVVMRGSNDVNPELPGHRWFSIGDRTLTSWSTPEVWTFSDGAPFFSPSSCSQLIRHSSGRLLWIGNICDQNPTGNRPRYPLVVVEVEGETGLLLRDTLTAIDDRRPGESERLTLSNFHALEDRETGELLITYPRFFADTPLDAPADFTADLTLLRCGIG